MRNARLASLFVFLSVLLVANVVRAAPCVPSDPFILVATGTTCDIGDKTFSFTAASAPGFTGPFLFIPDATNALAPSFTIAPAAVGGFTLTQPNSTASFVFSFDVSTIGGSPTLVGLDVTVNGNVSGGTPTTSGGGGTVVDAANESNLALTPLVFPEACIQSGGGFSGCLMNASTASAVGTFLAGPVSAENGTARIFVSTDATGTATFLSASYSFDQVQVAQAPEPATLALLGIALAGLGFSRRKPIAN